MVAFKLVITKRYHPLRDGFS